MSTKILCITLKKERLPYTASLSITYKKQERARPWPGMQPLESEIPLGISRYSF